MAKTTTKPTRLYQKAVLTSYKRARKALIQRQSLVKIQGVNSSTDAAFYLGKKVAYVYKCKKAIKNSHFRVIWGKVRRAHGHNGTVIANFRKNLPPQSFGAPCRIMLYPSAI